eukprot:8553151-Alexandrium_andersonii.AAC.1
MLASAGPSVSSGWLGSTSSSSPSPPSTSESSVAGMARGGYLQAQRIRVRYSPLPRRAWFALPDFEQRRTR